MLFTRVVEIVFPVYAIIAVGWYYARRHATDMEVANRLNMDVFAPALVFHALATTAVPFADYGRLMLGGTLIVLGSGAIAYPLCRYLRVSPKTLLPPVMFNNAGNVGIPLAILAFGDQALPAAVLLLILEMILQITLGVRMLDRNAPLAGFLRSPLLIATAAGIAWGQSGLTLPSSVATAVKLMGTIAIPLMLFALGVRLTSIDLSAWRIGVLGAVLRPLTGLVVFVVAAPLLSLTDFEADLLLLFAVLPPAVMNFIFAERYRQEPEAVASIVMFGNLLGVVTLSAALAFVLR